jgi:hypothetical protein
MAHPKETPGAVWGQRRVKARGRYSGVMLSSSTASIKRASSSPRPDTLTRFDTGHMRKSSFGAGRKSSTPAFPVSQASFLERSSMTGMRS